ncbi:hypothetical protein [Rhodococcus sp. BH5]|uniref:hypothetical protein n=1 Tax=Rhodococcus sp. BH5 TaxID=2871702 RepID=UPI0022CD7861|nr:hypothetical protein [Rhodococcus sp. BH5]MCZ9634699.1 hypothetical protein [Rhodococcus sp. BH5]
MSDKTELLRRGAKQLLSDHPGVTFEELRGFVAEWMRAEAIMLDATKPAIDLLNHSFESKTGIRSYLKLRIGDDGEIELRTDTTTHAEVIARASIGNLEDE